MAEEYSRMTLTVGEVAKRSGVAVSTLHFYEAKGLIEGWRSDGNQRRYHRAILRRVAIIRVAQRAGIPLAAIREALAGLPLDHAPTAEDWRRFTAAWTGMLEERITSLTQLRDQLSLCIGCGCLSLTDCPLRNPDDTLAADGPGPRCLSPGGDRKKRP
ncbi:redox-sensitive transcriptional activator SoxR [Zavarzinia compransoris]|uniref:Redox-sensitive transcriptional activator SoxR n=1 Tax=Zavarzinia compransoris TaxID=1264899 RepID=A0A317EAT1_9PROT|nr:redox-sensitive transcriptional activator SoxR [Zavarzinia compransoris]PWR23260.1 redox-sensitive transcriptional activator SoxR [Zavarzinia compransoris]TDP46175.1 MerR family transcriptional regulator [Zavarzinia compransoris]